MDSASRTHWMDWDRLGIGLSALCAVHCLLTPVVLSLLPLWHTLHALRSCFDFKRRD